MELVLGIDLGTSFFKVGLFDREGNLHGSGRAEVIKDRTAPGCCELPVTRLWGALNEGLDQACRQAGAGRSYIKAVSYASQANTFLLLNKCFEPLTPLILWSDSRVHGIDKELEVIFNRGDFARITGLGIPVNENFCCVKLKWIAKNHPELRRQTCHVMTLPDYLCFALTGKRIIDAGTASLLAMEQIRQRCWWREILNAVGLAPESFSTIRSPGYNAGKVLPGNRLGIAMDAVFVVGSLDHHVAAIGAGVPMFAPCSESTGTVLACVSVADEYRPAPGRCVGAGTDGTYYQLVFTENGASAFRWYQRNYAPDLSLEQLTALAARVSPGCDGLKAKPCADRYPDLSGFINSRQGFGHGHFSRAIMESTARSLGQLILKLHENEAPGRIIATGGGAKNDLWLQIKTDMTGLELIATDCDEPACRGAAMLGALAFDWFDSLQDITAAWVKVKKRFQPEPDRAILYRRLRR